METTNPSSITLGEAQIEVQRFHGKFKFAINKLRDLQDAKRASLQDRDDLSLQLVYQQKLGEWHNLGMQRFDLICEELSETIRAWRECRTVDLADGLGDLLYVVLGTCVAAGIDISPIFNAVHKSNMSKTPDNQFKPAKGPGFEAPNIEQCLRMQKLV